MWQTLCGARHTRSGASLWPRLKPNSSIQRSLLGRNEVKRKPECRALGPTTKPMRSLTAETNERGPP